METTDITTTELRARLAERQVSISALARAAKVRQPYLSALLSGRVTSLGPTRRARIEAAIIRLRLDVDEPERPPAPPAPPVTFRIRQL